SNPAPAIDERPANAGLFRFWRAVLRTALWLTLWSTCPARGRRRCRGVVLGAVGGPCGPRRQERWSRIAATHASRTGAASMADHISQGHVRVEERAGGRRVWVAEYQLAGGGRTRKTLGPAWVRASSKKTARGAVVWRAAHGSKPDDTYLT